MKQLSTGDPSTLGSYRKLSVIIFGEDSEVIKFIDKKIKESPNKEKEEVLTDESQMFYMLTTLHFSNC